MLIDKLKIAQVLVLASGLAFVFSNCSVKAEETITIIHDEVVSAPKIEPIPIKTELIIVDTMDLDETRHIAEVKFQDSYDQLMSRKECSPEWFLEYKELLDKYKNITDITETLENYYTEDEIYLMERVIETECFGACMASKVNVANCILNRINNEKFGNTVSEVIIPGQFSYDKTNITQDTKLALEYAFIFEDTTNGSLYFKNWYTPTFNGEQIKHKDEYINHFFY